MAERPPPVYTVNDAVTLLRTASDVASELGIANSRVRQIANESGIGTMFGTTRVFTPTDVEAIRQRNRRPGPRTDIENRHK